MEQEQTFLKIRELKMGRIPASKASTQLTAPTPNALRLLKREGVGFAHL